MEKGLGLAALVLSILAIFIPVISIYIIWLSLALAAIAGFLGNKTFPIATTLANLVNILFMSPMTLMAFKGENLGGQSAFLTTTILLFIATIVTIIIGAVKGSAKHAVVGELEKNCRKRTEVKKIPIFSLVVLGVVALLIISSGVNWIHREGENKKFYEEIERQFDSKVVKCGDSWYATGGLKSYIGGGLLELKNPTLDISSDKLSNSDVANGVQFRGKVHVKVKLYREYNKSTWDAWKEANDHEAIGGLPLFSGGAAGFLQIMQSPGVFPVLVQNEQYTWPQSFNNAKRPALDCSQLQKEVIGESTPQISSSGIQAEPLFTSSAPPKEKNEPTILTLQFNSKDSDGWVKRQDIDLWVKPAPPYNEPPQTLEAKGAWLLDKADPINFRVKQRLAVYKTPDINSSIDYYLEPGQAAQIYEGYEKTIRPGVIHLKNDWKDPDTSAVYKAGENINFYIYQEGGCYWFMYSQKTNGQFGDGYCPLNGGEVGDVDNGEKIGFFRIRALTSDIPSGWIKSTEDLWQVYIGSNTEMDKQQPPQPLDQSANEEVPKSTQVIEPLLPKPTTEANVENNAPPENSNGAQLVMQLLDYATKDNGINHETEIQDIKQKIDALPKPSKGQRKSARELNDQALLLLNNEQFEGAVTILKAANQLDKSDPEIINNLGYALMKQGNFDLAETALIEALTISPGRSTAWDSLGDNFGLKNDMPKAITSYENVYRFSKNRLKTHQFMQKLNVNEDVSTLKQARQTAMNWAEKMFADEILQQITQPSNSVSESTDNTSNEAKTKLNPKSNQDLIPPKNNEKPNKQATITPKKSLPKVQLDKMAIDFFH